MAEAPVFAVVGHPNKGKSSVVATLALTDAPEIAAESGTTRRSIRYDVTIGEQTVYSLYDTPGFQRARAAKQWIDEHEGAGGDHTRAVAAFVEQHAEGKAFVDEVELLRPVVEGAAVIYVADAARPYGPEFDAEIDILRGTGQPLIALINPIGSAEYADQWREVLERRLNAAAHVFNPLTAQFGQCLKLLEAFAHLRGAWEQPIRQAVASLREDRHRRHTQAAQHIAAMLGAMLTTTVSDAARTRQEAKDERFLQRLRAKLLDSLRAIQEKARLRVEQVYGHNRVEREEEYIIAVLGDLFSHETWLRWGPSRRTVARAGMIGGAAVGGLVGGVLGGPAATIAIPVGAAIVSISAWYGYGRLAAAAVGRVRLGEERVVCGPVSDPRFPEVAFNLALAHQRIVAERRHAVRSRLELHEQHGTNDQATKALDPSQRRRLNRIFKRLTGADGERRDALVDELTALITPLCEAADRFDSNPSNSAAAL